jgi:hypothetical protein
MPKAVIYATRSLYLGVACYLAANAVGIAQIQGSGARGDAQFMLFLMTLALCAVYCLLVSRISERSKLALIVLSVLAVVSIINLVANLGSISKQMESNPLVAALGVAATCMQTIALVLLLMPSSREWFWNRAEG